MSASHDQPASTSAPAMPLPSAVTAAAVAACSLLLLSLRLAWTRLRLTARVQPDLRDPTRRSAGTLCGWYAHNRRVVVQAYRLRASGSLRPDSDSCSSIPTLAQLQCALSRVALKHPILLAMPSPDSAALVCQLSDAEVDARTQTIAFPLAPLREAVIEVADQRDPEDLVRELLHAYPDAPPAPTEAAFAARHSVPVRWCGVRVYLLPRSSGRFDLVVHTAHVLMDGLSTVQLVRLLLDELSSTVMRVGYVAPSRVPLSALQPLAAYPVLDWLVDLRPRLGYVLTALVGSKLPKWLSGEREAWVGRRLAAADETESVRATRDTLYADLGTTECIRVQLDAPALERLRLAAKAEGATVQGVLAIAASFAAAVLAADDPASAATSLKLGTAYSARALCNAPTTTPLKASEIMGNLFGDHASVLALSAVARQPFWEQARSYLAKLNDARSNHLALIGLIRLVSVPDFLEGNARSGWRHRGHSLLLSNLGVIDLATTAAASASSSSSSSSRSTASSFQLLHAMCVQPVHHPRQSVGLFNHNIASCAQGGLCDTVAYASHTVSRANAERHVAVFKHVLERVAKGQACEFAQIRAWSQQQSAIEASPSSVAAVAPAELDASAAGLRSRHAQ